MNGNRPGLESATAEGPGIGRILIVEDNPLQARQLQSILAGAGYEVESISDGAGALRILAASRFDLVISDVIMPLMSGFELCAAIKANPDLGHMPVMLLTSLNEPDDIIQGLECGADNFITKPYDAHYLLGRVNNILQNKLLRQQGKVRIGAEVVFLGKTLTINSDKEQILDLLVCTFEDVVRTNRELRKREAELADARAQLQRYARQLEGQVRTSEGKYHRLMEQANDAILILDTEGRVQDANRRAAELVGEPGAAMIGNSYERWLNRADIEERKRSFARLLREGAMRSDNTTLRRADGREIQIDLSASVVEVDGQRMVLTIAHDVTERNQAQLAVARLASLVEGSDDAIIGRTLDGVITSWNPGAERLYGYSAAEMIGTTLARITPADRLEELHRVMEQVNKGQRVPLFETTRQRKDGTLIDVAISVSPIRDRDGQITGASIITQDISRLKRLEEQFRQAQKMEAIGQLAAGVAHDFNNLLTVISGYGSLLVNSEHLDNNARKMMLEIQQASDRAASLTRQLLAFSRKQIITMKPLSVNTVVADSERLLRRLIGEDIRLTTKLQPDLWSVNADAGQLEQVIMNLAINARDAMPQGGQLIIETSNVELDEAYAQSNADVAPGPHVLLAVSDTGCGMDEQTRAHIFEPFFTTKGPGKGTGLGLATVYGIVKQFKGHIWVYTEPGAGTTFKIYLPQSREAAGAPTTGTGSSIPKGWETVLVAEDEGVVRAVICHVLNLAGYYVLEAVNGRDAIDKCRSHGGPVHLLVSDVVMPEMGGRELAQSIKELQPNIKVLFVSGYTDDAVVRHGIQAGEAHFLQKPFTFSGLATMVRKVLSQPE